MSHVHAFSCIRTFKFLYLLLYLVWCFSDCLSLSLSFSPFLSVSYISCVMTPKRKSIPSCNPLRSGASSSSSPFNPTPSHVQFRDKKAKSDFLENFSQRGIHSECQVILSGFSDTDLPTVIYSRGQESLCGTLVTCPLVIIQEFDFNMHRFDYSIPQFVTHVRGICMVVTLGNVSDVLHVPKVVHPNYPGYEHLRTVSKDELSSLF